MKISELLQENELPRPGSKLPSAASLDDEPEELEFDDEVDGEEVENDFEAGVNDFKNVGAEFGPDLYSFSSIEYFDGWDARNATGLVDKIRGIDLEGMSGVAGSMSGASGRDGALTFVIVNGRSGEVAIAGFGMDAVSDGIQMDTLDDDQQSVVNKINLVNRKFSANGGGADEENKFSATFREQLLMLLSYGDQPEKSDKPAIDISAGRTPRTPEQEKELDDYLTQRADARRAKRRAALAARGL
jgi:hypothetical protein